VEIWNLNKSGNPKTAWQKAGEIAKSHLKSLVKVVGFFPHRKFALPFCQQLFVDYFLLIFGSAANV